MIDTIAERKQEYISLAKQQLTIGNIFVYLLFIVGIFGLGLLNWATLTFDWEAITIAYLIHFGLQVISYASIISSMSVNQLNKNKKTDSELYDLRSYINKVLMYYRPEKLEEYVYNENLKEKKKEYLKQYKYKLKELERKESSMENSRLWRNYIAEKKENESVEPPNKYCYKKELYLDKINNWEEYYEEEYVEYDEITVDDLTIGISKNTNKRVNRNKESLDVTLGVLRGLIFTVAGGLLIAVIVPNFQDGGWNGIIKTFLVVFFALLSVVKGLNNGDRVFENTTMDKVKFRKNQLHGYVIFEATRYKYDALGGDE